MSSMLTIAAEKEYSIRFKEWTEADKEYENLGKQYLFFGVIIEGQPLPNPQKVLDDEGYRILKEASKKLDKCKKAFDKATKDLYDAYRK
ncbi:MAG: hypothetical protein ABSF74_03795 [Dehalococcoidia bacterium]